MRRAEHGDPLDLTAVVLKRKNTKLALKDEAAQNELVALTM